MAKAKKSKVESRKPKEPRGFSPRGLPAAMTAPLDFPGHCGTGVPPVNGAHSDPAWIEILRRHHLASECQIPYAIGTLRRASDGGDAHRIMAQIASALRALSLSDADLMTVTASFGATYSSLLVIRAFARALADQLDDFETARSAGPPCPAKEALTT